MVRVAPVGLYELLAKYRPPDQSVKDQDEKDRIGRQYGSG